jgi:hypothetical protein
MKKIFTLLFMFLMVGSAFGQESGSDTQWLNFLRKGTLSDDPIGGGKTNFTGRFGKTNRDEKGVVVDDPVDGQPALTVTTIAYNYKEQQLDEEGNPVTDVDDNPVYKMKYQKEDGSFVDEILDWDTQFHVSIPHKFKTGEKFKLKFSARADHPVGIYAQAHSTPGNYLENLSLSGLDLTEEWQDFIFEGTNGEGEDAVDGMQTISFNCNTNKTDVITFYFRFDEFSCNMNDVKLSERILKKETLKYPVPPTEASYTLDMTPMVETLGIDDLKAFLSDATMKMVIKTTDEETGVTVETASGAIQALTGAFIDENGKVIDDEAGLNIYMPEEGINGNEVILALYNVSMNLEAGKIVRATILFEKDNWFYAYNLLLMTPEDYENPNSGSAGTIYSWESPDGIATETGGKATFECGDEGENRVNYYHKDADRYTLSLNGKKTNIDDTEYSKNTSPRIIITLDNPLYGGEQIQVTAYTFKRDASKLSTPFFKFENGTTLFDDSKTYIDLGVEGNTEPVTNTYEVPEEAFGSTWFKMTRSQSATNLFITKLVIVSGESTGIAEIKQVNVENGFIYNLAGQRVDDSYKGLVIRNGQKFVQK